MIITPQIKEAFFAQVDVRGPDECWPWTGPVHDRDRDRHGLFWFGECRYKRRERAHRVAYLIKHGESEHHIRVRHTCGNPLCCNERHMQACRLKRPPPPVRTERKVIEPLNPLECEQVRQRHAAGEPLVQIAREYNVPVASLGKIIEGD